MYIRHCFYFEYLGLLLAEELYNHSGFEFTSDSPSEHCGQVSKEGMLVLVILVWIKLLGVVILVTLQSEERIGPLDNLFKVI